MDCYALLDTCSTASYILSRTVHTLGIQPKRTIELQLTLINEQSLLQAGIVSLKIGTYISKRPFFTLINVHAVDSMKLRPPDVKRLNEICQTCTHLNHVTFPCLPDNSVQLFLGIDAFQYIATREILQGPKPSPFAVQTSSLDRRTPSLDRHWSLECANFLFPLSNKFYSSSHPSKGPSYSNGTETWVS